jgi:hypothetical protein
MAGILAWLDLGPRERAEFEREHEEDCKRREAEAKAAADAEAWGLELRKRCAEIDLFAGKYMRPQIEAQRVTVKPIDKRRFRELLEFCREDDWPTNLPVLPHALYEFCVTESRNKGFKHILAIVKSIARIHEAAGEDMCCPTRDPLVKAFLALCREEEETQNSNQKDS